MKSFKEFVCMALATMLVACAGLGIPTPDTFNKKAAVAITSVAAVRESATTLLVAGKISTMDAKNVQAQADNAMAGITIARNMSASAPDLPAANVRLDVAIATLTALQTYLATKGPK